ncbi:hypothetical protein AGMMS50284_7380 [Clostridia bacterium]|nr:hypothetical protein AGMMS50284_7380 [Clostridia bacterium]
MQLANPNEASKILFCDYAKLWLNNVKNRVRRITYNNYASRVDRKIYPYFYSKKIMLVDLKAKDIQDFFQYLFNIGSMASTVNVYRTTLYQILHAARLEELIVSNPVDLVPKIKTQKQIVNFYNEEELKKLMEVMKDTKIELPMIFAIYYRT